MRTPADIRNDAMECLRLADQATAPKHKALFVTLAQAWAQLAEQAEQLQDTPKEEELTSPALHS